MLHKHYRLFIATVSILIIGTVVYHYLEGWSWIDSFYFSVMTLTTVGYGDLFPTSDISKVFTSIYVIVGIGLIYNFINAFYDYRVEKIKKRKSIQNKED